MEVSLDGSGGSGERRGQASRVKACTAGTPGDPLIPRPWPAGGLLSLCRKRRPLSGPSTVTVLPVSGTRLCVYLRALALRRPARCPSDTELVLLLLLPPLLCLFSLLCPPQRLSPSLPPSPQLRATLYSLRPALFWLLRDPCELPVQGTDLRPQCLGFCGLQWC